MRRQLEDCDYRVAQADRDIAICQLLVELTHVKDATACAVQREACQACCEHFPPNRQDINPVVAALLFGVTEAIQRQGGVPGCDAAAARSLNQWAEKCLPLLESGEDDNPALPKLQTLSQSEVKLGKVLPLPANAVPREEPLKWSVGVTTCPRRLSTIDACLDSLNAAGWRDVRLFMDDEVELAPRHADLPRSVRIPRLGAWPNYYASLTEMVMRDPQADVYMLVQDDTLFYGHSGLRDYLERFVADCDLVSLFCPRDYSRREPGWYVLEEAWFWGALAFVFSRPVAQTFLTDQRVMSHRWHSDYGGGVKGIDVVIGSWAERVGADVYYPSPSLVQHIGEVSTMWDTARAAGPRRAARYLGDPE